MTSMSPRKVATVKAAAAKAATGKAVTKRATSAHTTSARAPSNKPAANGSASEEPSALAARIERALRDGRSDTLTPQAFQALMAALCKNYGTQLEAGAQFLPLASQTSASPTEVMTTTSALLKAANLAVFELGMWQSWTGR